jgi:hypothetical protein
MEPVVWLSMYVLSQAEKRTGIRAVENIKPVLFKRKLRMKTSFLAGLLVQAIFFGVLFKRKKTPHENRPFYGRNCFKRP